MQQYFIKENLSDLLTLKDETFHYLNNVIKVHTLEEIILFNGEQKAIYSINLIDKKAKEIIVKKVKEIKVETDYFKLDLAIGLLKRDNIELTIQKTTELGINEILLLKLKNNVVKFDDSKVMKKLKRYNEIALNACEQCKRDNLSHVKYLNDIKSIPFDSYDYVFLAHERSNKLNIREMIDEIENIRDQRVLYIVGPEGGFSNDEIEFFLEHAKPVLINTNILRAETAAIVGIGIIKALENEV